MTVLCAAVMLCATAAFAADETYVVKLSGDYVSLFSDADGDDDGLLSLGFATAKSLEEAQFLVNTGVAESYEEDCEAFLFDESYEPPDSMYEKQYVPEQIGATSVWRLGIYGEGVKVCIIDSGCSAHEDIDESIVYRNNLLYSEGSGSSAEDVTDDIGHGTHVAGIVAARLNGIGVVGIAPKCSLGIIRCFTSDGTVTTKASHIAKAISAAVDEMDADVINMSLGVVSNSSVLEAAVKKALENDVVVVAAVGNRSSANNFSDAVMYPAGYDGVIGVASVNNSGVRASNSVKNITVDVAAGGVGIYSLKNDGTYTPKSGTSMATPAVAGMAALIRSYNRTLTNTEVNELVTSTATPVGTAVGERCDEYGYGLANAEKAVKSLVPKGIFFSKNNTFTFGGVEKKYFSVFNNLTDGENVSLVCAEYNTLNKMTAIACHALENGDVLNFSRLVGSEGTVKLFALKSLESLIPVCRETVK